MSVQKQSKNKIGARCLSDSEAELIMPNYKRIYNQIDQFRTERKIVDDSEEQKVNGGNKDQKTNNIGIIGARGAGKTSILKTIRIQLEKEQQTWNDIILPIIVPENMSESGTLMATVLGMLNEVIKERDEKEKKGQKKNNIDCIKRTSLRRKYDEVIKQYTYIQKEYRDILIRQYTTEGDYVNRSTSVFNSDTEFINKFNELIDELVDTKKQNRSLLFLFIDDIDLSTYRCADVVKTLLSYLSNENIVTFISGDLETFEEALTLDFLRQENVLDKEILDKEIGSNTLLDSKKQLAYEYLKKIIPPAYRYNIKLWSLEEKGNYCIADEEENRMKAASSAEGQKEKEQKTGVMLSELLAQKLKGWVDPAFFCYVKTEEGAEEKTEKKNLPYTYHLFDNTSRGLNNVYNVLDEISDENKEQGMDDSKEKKLLLDTIISSKPVYNKYRNDIQQNFFHIGTNADSRVFFDNATAVIYQSGRTEAQKGNPQSQEEYYIKDPVERFSLFILVDFAARLLYGMDHYEKRIKEDECYKNLKDKAMKDLFFHPVIAERVMEISDYRWESENEEKPRNEATGNGKKEYPALENMKLKDVNSSFLLNGDLTLNLAYYRNLPLDGILRLYENRSPADSDSQMLATVELDQSVVIAMWRAFSSIAEVNKKEISDIIARYYSVFWKEFAYIRNQLSSSAAQNIVMRLFSDEINDVVKNESEMPRILSNTLTRILVSRGKDEIEDKWVDVKFDELYIIDEKDEKKVTEDNDRKKIERRVEILKAIDSRILWQAEAAETVAEYLKMMINGCLKNIKWNLEEGKEEKKEEEKKGWKLKTSSADESWKALKEAANRGISNTVAKRAISSIRKIFEGNDPEFQEGMPLDKYINVIGEIKQLAGNNRVWYGQSEAQQILNDLQKAPAEPKTQEWDTWISNHSYFVFLLQCLYKCKMEEGRSENIAHTARLLSNIAKKLPDAHKEADKLTLENFMDELNRNLDEKVDSKCFEELFRHTAKE